MTQLDCVYDFGPPFGWVLISIEPPFPRGSLASLDSSCDCPLPTPHRQTTPRDRSHFPHGSAVCNWRHQLGDDWESCARFLKSTGHAAATILDPRHPPRHLELMVDGDEDFVAMDGLRHQSNMKDDSMEARVERIKKRIDGYRGDPEHVFTLEPIPEQTIKRLRDLEYFPPDMLMILEQIGGMRNWGWAGCAMVDWWVPCPIERARTEGRCGYELDDSNFSNPSSLLFFAWDCDAKCHFYDTTETPWKVVVCDGLSLSICNQKKSSGTAEEWGGLASPWEEDDDALSVIERWI